MTESSASTRRNVKRFLDDFGLYKIFNQPKNGMDRRTLTLKSKQSIRTNSKGRNGKSGKA
jgi:hypothetical protein